MNENQAIAAAIEIEIDSAYHESDRQNIRDLRMGLQATLQANPVGWLNGPRQQLRELSYTVRARAEAAKAKTVARKIESIEEWIELH